MSIFQNNLLAAAASTIGPSATSGALWAWGQNNQGQFGNDESSNTAVTSPIQIGTDENFSLVAGGGADSFRVLNDGTFWAVGGGNLIPDGAAAPARSTPYQVGTLTDWATSYQSMGGGHEVAWAIKADGTMWGWGELWTGDGTTTTRHSTVQIGTLTDWAIMSPGRSHVGVIKTDNTLWTWGAGARGKLGHGNNTNQSSPVQVGSLTDWAKVACSQNATSAIKTDGTMWQWGDSDIIGNGSSTESFSSPIQIGSETYWAELGAGDNSLHATTTSGTYFGWGANVVGVIGDGTTTRRNSPVQIGSLTDWDKWYNFSGNTSGNTCLAIKTDGTLWGIGENSVGQLGIGDTTDRSSPVQIGSETDWISVDVGQGASLGIRET